MLTCPMCKKTVRGTARECPTCRTDLGILVDYLGDLDGGLNRALEKTRAGELGEAVWAYLEVLEVDPDNVEARRQIGKVVTAVRMFDEVKEGRRWVDRLRRRARIRRWFEDISDMQPRGWFTIAVMIVMLVAMLGTGFWFGFEAAQPGPPQVHPPTSEPSDKGRPRPGTPEKSTLKGLRDLLKGAPELGKP